MNFIEMEDIKTKIISEISGIFTGSDYVGNLEISQKSDRTIVTKMDLFISGLLKSYSGDNVAFLSEEEAHNYEDNKLPRPIMILDPVDGTKELSLGIGECVLSVAVVNDDPVKNFAWIFNPFTGFQITTEEKFYPAINKFPGISYGLVSRSEWNDGLYKKYDCEKISLSPRGSIAFKLSLLASGACDFVITLKPKSIWDIAAGTILCWQRGFKMYEGDLEITSLEKLRYNNPICWCKDDDHRRYIYSALK